MRSKLVVTAFVLFCSLTLSPSETGGRRYAENLTASGYEAEMITIDMDVTRKETSKDSNWSRCVMKYENGQVSCEWTYGGFNAPKDRTASFFVSPSTERKIVEYVRVRGLDRSIREHGQIDGIGVSAQIKCTIRMDDEVHTIDIQGMISPWGTNHDHENIMLNLPVYRDIVYLMNAAEHSFEHFQATSPSIQRKSTQNN